MFVNSGAHTEEGKVYRVPRNVFLRLNFFTKFYKRSSPPFSVYTIIYAITITGRLITYGKNVKYHYVYETIPQRVHYYIIMINEPIIFI